MTTDSKGRRRLAVLVAIVVAAVTLVPTTTASADGKYGNLTARWWQWVTAQETVDVGNTNTNPVLDSTGEFAAAGQEHGIGPGRKYFFLAGTFGGTVTRRVTVPHGKSLFFPIFNLEVDNAVEPPTDFTVRQLRALVTAAVDRATEMAAELDGENVEFFRVKSPTFGYTVPEENSIYDYFGLFGPQFEGRIKPAVADGYWAVVPPLPPGRHVLHFHSADPSTGFMLDVTYRLRIE